MKKLKQTRVYSNVHIKRVSILSLIILFTLGLLPNAFAQDNSKHEFSIYGGAGISTLRYEEWNNTDRKDKFGGLVGLGYTYFFSEHWGLNTGVEAAFYYAGLRSSQLTSTYMTNDGSAALLYKATQTSYYERQRTALLQIPLMAQYQTGGKNKFYAALGVKLGIPMQSKYRQIVGGLTTSGYYPLAGIEVTSPTSQGFGSYGKYENEEGDLDFKLAGLASIEAGMKWHLSDKFSLYTGVYFDHGITNINKGNFKQSVEYTKSTPKRNASMDLAEFKGTDVNPVAVGIKVRLSMFGCKGKKVAPTPAPAPETRPAPEAKPAPQPAAPTTRPAPAQPNVPIAPTVVESATLAMPIINFEYNKSILTNDMKAILDSKVDVLKKYSDVKLECVGHTSTAGPDVNNYELGMKRAQVVKDYLVGKGIDSSRISLKSEGEKHLAYPEDTEASKSKNRRVEFTILK